MDILRDGIVLFEESDYSFVEPQPLSPEKALQETREYYEDWFGTAQEFVDGAEFHLGKEHFNLAAFNYHQATERLYHCLFLVRTLYSPKTHNLNRLRDSDRKSPRLNSRHYCASRMPSSATKK